MYIHTHNCTAEDGTTRIISYHIIAQHINLYMTWGTMQNTDTHAGRLYIVLRQGRKGPPEFLAVQPAVARLVG